AIGGVSSRIHAQRNGSARNTRQNALAYGPTSAQRTNSTDAPIAIAPSTSATNASATRLSSVAIPAVIRASSAHTGALIATNGVGVPDRPIPELSQPQRRIGT